MVSAEPVISQPTKLPIEGDKARTAKAASKRLEWADVVDTPVSIQPNNSREEFHKSLVLQEPKQKEDENVAYPSDVVDYSEKSTHRNDEVDSPKPTKARQPSAEEIKWATEILAMRDDVTMPAPVAKTRTDDPQNFAQQLVEAL